jgi:hypothetical protein
MINEKLPKDRMWAGAHVSELGLTAMADGQESILGDDVVAHVQACESCTGRLGRIALASSAVGEALALTKAAVTAGVENGGAPAQREITPVQRPWGALALGVAVAMLAAAPTLHDVLRAPAFASTFVAHTIKALVHVGITLATSNAVSRGLPSATLVASALLVLMGWAIARWVPREGTVASGGSRS